MSEDINEKLENIFKSAIFVDGSTYLAPTNVNISDGWSGGLGENKMLINVEFIVCHDGQIDKNSYILVPVKDIKKIE